MNRPRREDETFKEYRENLKKEEKELREYLSGKYVPNNVTRFKNGMQKIAPRHSTKKNTNKVRIDKNKKGE